MWGVSLPVLSFFYVVDAPAYVKVLKHRILSQQMETKGLARFV